ncbi:hypothetical protein GCM10011416_14050 [Polaribacter pacificus]|uniref:tRNA (Guanine-N1)-methyltransferase n=1 Tax=Polaribacter pacificus TaxID=1775173 RepID=A0A917HYD0_9FLAO|nr:hypothetical protein [Polaribacter pacificus]GGG97249.1 hypothetical protein GCM10011416_14050 [Polaribacter pacificus]
MKFFTLFLSLLLTTAAFSQQSKDTINTNSLDEQYKKLYKSSNNYQEYKVVLKEKLTTFHSNILDSVKNFNTLIDQKNSLITQQQKTISNLEKEKLETQKKLNEAVKKEDSISLFGWLLQKTLYNTLMFGVIILLFILLFYFIFKFKNSNIVTQKAILDLEDVENEFAIHRKKTLEKEQKLRRALQDEINKNRTS